MAISEYENPACTTDVILENNVSEVLLIKRGEEPYLGRWALPGGHINLGLESVEETGARELREETGLVVKTDDLELVGVYSAPDRDPRGHYITHVYSTRNFSGELEAGDDADDTGWFDLRNLPELAFDHRDILRDYNLVRLRK